MNICLVICLINYFCWLFYSIGFSLLGAEERHRFHLCDLLLCIRKAEVA